MKKILVLLTVFLYSVKAFAVVTASLSTNEAAIGDVVSLQITADENISSQPDLTPLEGDFNVVSSSLSHQSYIINGAAQSSTTWKIGLMPLKKGLLTIPAISVGKDKTQPLTLEVKQTPSQIAQKTQNGTDTDVSTAPVYALRAELKSPSQPFVQQEIRYDVILTDNGSVDRGEPSFEPNTDFLIKLIQSPTTKQNAQGQRETTFSYALFSLKSGKMTIPTAYFKGFAYQKPNVQNIFGNGFFSLQMPSAFGLETPVNLAFEGPEIDIRPILQNYGGAWWLPAENVTLEATFSNLPQKISVGTPIVREITLKAEGLTDTQLPEIAFEDVAGLKIYPEKPIGETTVLDGKIIGSQKTLVTYIPDTSGTIELPEIKIKWYDIKDEKIKEAVLKKEFLNIASNPNISSENNKLSVLEDKKEPDFIKTNTVQSPYLIALLAFLMGVVLAYFILRPKSEKPVKIKEKPVNHLRNIEKEKDLKKLRDELILWGQKKYPDNKITNLKDMADILKNKEFEKQIDLLNLALYHEKNDSEFNTKQFVKIFKNTVQKNLKNKKVSEPLPPLYEK